MNILLKKLIIVLSLITSLTADQLVDINSKIEMAKNEEKKVMFFFHIPHCPYCKAMLDENFKDKKILNIIEKSYILIDMYTADNTTVVFDDFKGNVKEFAKYIGALAYPATIFLDESGKTVHKAIGYRNIKEHLTDMKYISTKRYKTKDLESFAIHLELNEDE